MILVAGAPSGASTWTVCADGCDFTLIQDAVEGAGAGDSIRLGAEVFVETVSVTQLCRIVDEGCPPLTIRGAGTEATTLRGTLTVDRVHVKLVDLTVADGLGCGVVARGFDQSTCNDRCPPSAYGRVDMEGVVIESSACGVSVGFAAVAITTTTIRDNLGNGIEDAHRPGTLVIDDSTVSHNVGDGIHMSRGGQVWLTNTTVSGNSGNGVHVSFNRPVISQSTIAGNLGYGISGGYEYQQYVYPTTFRLKGNLVSGNLGGDCNEFVEPESNGGNLSSDGSCDLYHETDLIDTDPLLLPLGDNGGATRTYALPAGSPAVDAAGESCGPADQRGVSRPLDGDGDGIATCDIGAYELAPPSVLVNQLMAALRALDLDDDIENSLLAKLNAALRILRDPGSTNDHAAANSLRAFVHSVEAQRRKRIGASDAETLITDAEAIIDLLVIR